MAAKTIAKLSSCPSSTPLSGILTRPPCLQIWAAISLWGKPFAEKIGIFCPRAILEIIKHCWKHNLFGTINYQHVLVIYDHQQYNHFSHLRPLDLYEFIDSDISFNIQLVTLHSLMDSIKRRVTIKYYPKIFYDQKLGEEIGHCPICFMTKCMLIRMKKGPVDDRSCHLDFPLITLLMIWFLFLFLTCS